jgi:hypothetical protein
VLAQVEGRTGLALAESQLPAVRLTLRSKVLVIAGAPKWARPRWSVSAATKPVFRRGW